MSHAYPERCRQSKFSLSIVLLIFVLAYFSSQTLPILSQESKSIQKNNSTEILTKTNIKENEVLDTWILKFFNYIKQKLEKQWFKSPSDHIIASILAIILFLFVIYLISIVLRMLLSRYLFKQLHLKTKNNKGQIELNKIQNIIFPLLTTFGVRLGLVSLESLFGFDTIFLKNILNAIIIVILSLLGKRILIGVIYTWDNQLSEGYGKVTKQLLPLTIGLSKVIIFSFGAMFALAFLGINIAPFVTSLGALTFAIGFAVKDSLSNFVAGILLIIDDSFLVGDKIDIPGIGFGYIHEIHLRTTRILTFDNEIIVIPNNVLMNKEYKNYRLPNKTIRIVVDFSVAYGSKVQQVKHIILNILEEDPEIKDHPPPVVEFISMADFYLAFKAKGYINSYMDQYTKRIEINEKIYEKLNQENISIPFPTHTVYLKKEENKVV